MQNYGYNPYQRLGTLKMIPVTNILEANAMPVDSLEPIFFYNRSENVIYKKQIDNTGAAPVQIFKMSMPGQAELNETDTAKVNTYEENFKALNDRLDGLFKILQPEEKEGGKK